MGKVIALTDRDYIAVGRRHGSEDVAERARVAAARWRRDVLVLTKYGHAQGALDAFNTLRSEHDTLRATRAQAIAAKATRVVDKSARVAAAKHWINRVSSLIEPLARADSGLAQQLNAALPANEGAIDASIGALSSVLEANAARFDADAGVQATLAEAASLRAGLADDPGAVATAKSATVTDTAEIDLLDGKLNVAIRDLNRAGRRAIRAGALSVPPGDYRVTIPPRAIPAPTAAVAASSP